MTATNDSGFDLLVAVRDRAKGEADRLDTEAAVLEQRAVEKRQKAAALRMLHETALAMTPAKAVTLEES